MTKKGGAVLDSLMTAGSDELAGELTGGSTLLALIRHGFNKRAQRVSDELFRAIAVATGVHDATKARELLDAHAEKDWFGDAIDAGFRDMVDTVDPLARACIASLVAEYVAEGRRPDARYRRAAQVVTGLDGTALPTLALLVSDYCSVIGCAKPGTRALIHGDRERLAPQKPLFWLAAPAAEGGGPALSEKREKTDSFDP